MNRLPIEQVILELSQPDGQAKADHLLVGLVNSDAFPALLAYLRKHRKRHLSNARHDTTHGRHPAAAIGAESALSAFEDELFRLHDDQARIVKGSKTHASP